MAKDLPSGSAANFAFRRCFILLFSFCLFWRALGLEERSDATCIYPSARLTFIYVFFVPSFVILTGVVYHSYNNIILFSTFFLGFIYHIKVLFLLLQQIKYDKYSHIYTILFIKKLRRTKKRTP